MCAQFGAMSSQSEPMRIHRQKIRGHFASSKSKTRSFGVKLNFESLARSAASRFGAPHPLIDLDRLRLIFNRSILISRNKKKQQAKEQATEQTKEQKHTMLDLLNYEMPFTMKTPVKKIGIKVKQVE